MQRPPPRFRSDEYFVQEASEEMFYPSLEVFIEIAMETPYWYLYGLAPTWQRETNRNICYRVLLLPLIR